MGALSLKKALNLTLDFRVTSTPKLWLHAVGNRLMLRHTGKRPAEFLHRQEHIYCARIQWIISLLPGTAGADPQPALAGTVWLLSQPAATRLSTTHAVIYCQQSLLLYVFLVLLVFFSFFCLWLCFVFVFLHKPNPRWVWGSKIQLESARFQTDWFFFNLPPVSEEAQWKITGKAFHQFSISPAMLLRRSDNGKRDTLKHFRGIL